MTKLRLYFAGAVVAIGLAIWFGWLGQDMLMFLDLWSAVVLGFAAHRVQRNWEGRYRKPANYAISYFMQLRADYDALPSADRASIPADLKGTIEKEIEELDQLVRGQAAVDTRCGHIWDCLFVLELCMIRALPATHLEQRAWLIRDRYRGVAGKERYEAYEASVKASPRDLQAEMGAILHDLYWLLRIESAWDEKRQRVLQIIGTILVGIGAEFFGIILALTLNLNAAAQDWHPLFLIVEVSLMGTAGGLVSLVQRLQNPNLDSQSRLRQLIDMEYGHGSAILQSFLTGSMFAVVLLLLFLSGLAGTGGVFPELELSGRAAGDSDFLALLRGLTASGVNVARVLAWSFVAGFAERLVPDFLDRLVQRSPSQGEKAS